MKELEKKLEAKLYHLISIILKKEISDENLIPKLMIEINDFYEQNFYESSKFTNQILLDLTISIYFQERRTPKNLLRASLINELYHTIVIYNTNN